MQTPSEEWVQVIFLVTHLKRQSYSHLQQYPRCSGCTALHLAVTANLPSCASLNSWQQQWRIVYARAKISHRHTVQVPANSVDSVGGALICDHYCESLFRQGTKRIQVYRNIFIHIRVLHVSINQSSNQAIHVMKSGLFQSVPPIGSTTLGTRCWNAAWHQHSRSFKWQLQSPGSEDTLTLREMSFRKQKQKIVKACTQLHETVYRPIIHNSRMGRWNGFSVKRHLFGLALTQQKCLCLAAALGGQ